MHMQSAGVVPTDHSLRRVMVRMAKDGDYEALEKLIADYYPGELQARVSK